MAVAKLLKWAGDSFADSPGEDRYRICRHSHEGFPVFEYGKAYSPVVKYPPDIAVFGFLPAPSGGC